MLSVYHKSGSTIPEGDFSMNRIYPFVAAVGFSLALLAGGCKSNDAGSSGAAMDMSAAKPSSLASITNAVAVLHPLGDSGVMGKVTFTQTADGVAVVADVSGLTPGKHGFHIHEWGDCSDPKGMSAGGHYNPEGEMHGLPGSPHHHPGDMGNLEADADGNAHLEITLPGITIAGDKDPILGRSVIVHVKQDDGSQPTGNAGGRIACGVIGVAKPK
jgi:Cu-Zn family superoxide dismutase